MTNTGINKNSKIIDQRASGYVRKGRNYRNAISLLNKELYVGASSIYSTATDLLKFDQALYGSLLLNEELKNLMFTEQRSPYHIHYGYGWFIENNDIKGKTVSHFGYSNFN